jgi:hypothetical protein
MADVAVPTALPLSTVPDVELMRTGTWQLSTGPATFTTGDLVSAVAALECPAVRRPILKLGHTDPRFDGQPAIGYVNNMATAAGASVLRGDYVGMPGWLTVDVLASAYPDRSIEGWWNYQCAVGHVHPFVVTGVALLGVSPPGIGVLESLQDVATLYGVAAASGAGGTPFAVRAGDFETLHPRGEHGHFRTKVSSEVAKLEAGIVNITGYDDDTIDVDFAVDGDQVVTTLTSDAAHSLNLAVSIFAEEDDGWTTQIPNGDRMIVVTRESDTNAIIDFGDGSGIEISPGDGEKLGQKLDDVSSDVQQHMESVIPEDSYAEIGGYTHILGYPDGTLGLLGYSDSDPNGDSTGERRLSQPDALKLANALIKVNKAPAASTGTTVQLSDGPIEIHKSLNGDLRIDLDPGNSTDTALSDQVVDIEGAYATSTLSHLLNFAKTGRDVLAASRSAMPNPNPTPVAAGVSVEDLRRAYYDGPGGSDWDSWISEIQLDPLQLIVSSDDGYQLVPVTVNGDSTITFGPPVPVEMTYTPKPAGDGSTTVAASRLVYASRAESRPPCGPPAARYHPAPGNRAGTNRNRRRGPRGSRSRRSALPARPHGRRRRGGHQRGAPAAPRRATGPRAGTGRGVRAAAGRRHHRPVHPGRAARPGRPGRPGAGAADHRAARQRHRAGRAGREDHPGAAGALAEGVGRRRRGRRAGARLARPGPRARRRAHRRRRRRRQRQLRRRGVRRPVRQGGLIHG